MFTIQVSSRSSFHIGSSKLPRPGCQFGYHNALSLTSCFSTWSHKASLVFEQCIEIVLLFEWTLLNFNLYLFTLSNIYLFILIMVIGSYHYEDGSLKGVSSTIMLSRETGSSKIRVVKQFVACVAIVSCKPCFFLSMQERAGFLFSLFMLSEIVNISSLLLFKLLLFSSSFL